MPGCGHVFELAAINDWVKAGNKSCPIDKCNCVLDADNVRIENGNVRLFQEVNNIIKKYPSLIAKRYFCIDIFVKILDGPNITNISTSEQIFLDQFIKILEEDPDKLNSINPKYGYSPLLLLCNYKELGHPILEKYIKIRNNITVEGLNAPSQANSSKNLTPLHMLLREQGLTILANDPVLRRKIVPKTWILVAENKGHEGIFPLLQVTNCPEGIEFLRQCPDVIDDISPEALNMVCVQGEHKGISPVLGLMAHQGGFALISDFPKLRRNIRSNALETVSESKSICKGISPLFILLNTPEGKALLDSDKDFFVSIITPKGINTICMAGSNKGKSPIIYLPLCDIGRKILHAFPVLCQMITLDTWLTPAEEGVDKGIFPLLIVAAKASGLLEDSLREILTADALLKTCEDGVNRGKSVYSILKHRNIALLIRIIEHNIFLRHDLGRRISLEDRQSFERCNISFSLPFHLRERLPEVQPANNHLPFSYSIFLKTVAGLTTAAFGVYMMSFGAPIAVGAGIGLLAAGCTLFGSAVLQNSRESGAERAHAQRRMLF